MKRAAFCILLQLSVIASFLGCVTACVYDQKLSVPKDDSKCRDLGGSCASKIKGCPNGRFVAYLCPGSPVCCVPSPTTECEQHLSYCEGHMYLEGYIPTSGSGVTIATGVDLGQRLPRGYYGLDEKVLKKLLPYMALDLGKPRNKRDVCSNPALNVNRLKITYEEAVILDNFFKGLDANYNSRYTNYLDRGKCVVQSLNHYCGSAVLFRKDNKCNFSGCPDFITDVLITKTATDSIFKAALIAHRSCIKVQGGDKYSHVVERFRKEICYIDSSESIC